MYFFISHFNDRLLGKVSVKVFGNRYTEDTVNAFKWIKI